MDFIPNSNINYGQNIFLVSDKGYHKKMKQINDIYNIANKPPKYLLGCKWLGVQSVFKNNSNQIRTALRIKLYK